AVAGAKLAAFCVPFRLYQKQLAIAVPDKIWQEQMQNMAGEFLFCLNRILGAPLVNTIEFRIDQKHLLNARRPDEKEIEFQHTAELSDELRAAAEKIHDETLREQFLRT